MAFLQLFLLTTIIHTITSQDCDNNTPGTLCVINGENAGSTITCRANDPCEIECDGSDSCGDDTIEASTATHVTITCDGTDACKGNTKIYCGTGDCILFCINSDTSCQDATIYNPNQRAHSFQCTGDCDTTGEDTIYTQAPSSSPTTSVPTPSPGTQSPTSDPIQNPSIFPTKTPSFFPSDVPTMSPTNIPSASPSGMPTMVPSKVPTKNPTNIPTMLPTEIPTAAPLFEGETRNPSEMPSNMPVTIVVTNVMSVSTSGSPTLYDHGGHGEVVDTTSEKYGSGGVDGERKESGGSNGSWIYIVATCGFICCCVGIIMIGCKTKKARKKKVSVGDTFRMNANNEMDFWTNPVHKQIGSMSGVEGNMITTQINSTNDVNSISESSDSNLEQAQFTVPAAVYNDDDGTGTGTGTGTTVEMSDLHNTTQGNIYCEGGVGVGDDEFEVMDEIMVTPNGDVDDGIDDINNNLENEMDNAIVEDIDNIITVGGDDGDGDDDYDCYTDEGGDTDIDEDEDDDDVIGYDLAHEMLTPGGDEVLGVVEIEDDDDDDVNIDDLMMDEEDENLQSYHTAGYLQ